MSKSLFQSELIRAGAGTGKTYQLIEKIYHLFGQSLKTENREPRLIVCTFTRKASQELKERLFEKSRESLLSFDSKTSLKNSFLDYISSPSLQVGTIDSILYHLLKKHGQEIELNPDFEISSESSSERLFDSFSEEFVYKKHFSLIRKIPYPHLKELLLAYYKYRIQQGGKHEAVSFYDTEDFKDFHKEKDFFKEKKKISLKDLNKYFTDNKTKLKESSTLYQIFLKFQELSKEQKTHQELKGNTQSSSQEKNGVDIKKLFKEEEGFEKEYFLPLFQEFQKVAEDFFTAFLKRKKNSPFLSIEDLLLFSYYLLDSNSKVSKKINQEWDYWLIDEYQDTSFLQDQVIDKITSFKNVFCVGDPGQSIYTFRGADPEVFKNREKNLSKTSGAFKKLKINRRSSPALISFYNDFFPEEKFVKFEQNPERKPTPESPDKKSCLSFFTYHLEERESVLPALFEHIKSLKQQAETSYGDIAVLCSKNEDLIQVANYLKEKAVPLMIYGSKKISQNRVVLDSLFLLKFLINPYDDNNLKALLRTPYFRISDQELANSCFDYEKEKKSSFPLQSSDKTFDSNKDSHFNKAPPPSRASDSNKGSHLDKMSSSSPYRHSFESRSPNNFEELKGLSQDKKSFWSFIKEKYQDKYFVESLSFHLENYKSKGLFESFKQALFDSGIMDLADFQDPRGSSSASLWKLLSLLKKNNKSPLNLLYDLTEKRIEDKEFEEPPTQEDSELVELMTIHKSKGLQFKHVIVLDFSMGKTILESNQQSPIIYDSFRKKMSFSVPLGARDKKKIKTYGHKTYSFFKRRDRIQEKDHLFYVAMTRAEQSLALFIPEGKKPEKNSWLSHVNYFKKVKKLMKEEEDQWSLNSGVYDRGQYLLTVKNCEKQELEKAPGEVYKKANLDKNLEKLKPNSNKKTDKSSENIKLDGSLEESSNSDEMKLYSQSLTQKKKLERIKSDKILENPNSNLMRSDLQNPTLKEGLERSLEKKEAQNKIQSFKSSADFIEYKRTLYLSNLGKKESSHKSESNKEDEKDHSLSSSFRDSTDLKEEAKLFQSKNHIKNILFKTGLGTQLHSFLNQLFYFSPEELKTLIENQEEKTKTLIHSALDYISNLRDPHLSSFLKKGFSEWSFKFKKSSLILQGQIDLWCQMDSVIHVIDYKSSAPVEKGFNSVRSQLVFYSWFLNEIYYPDQIFMYECHPFQKRTIKTKFTPKDKKELDLWIDEELKSQS